jgi:hypothetical protein
MIVWINGAFGSGKTTTAGLLTKRLDGAKLFDPEYVGYLLMSFVESPTGRFPGSSAVAAPRDRDDGRSGSAVSAPVDRSDELDQRGIPG